MLKSSRVSKTIRKKLHENIKQLFYIVRPLLVLEYCSNGDLRTFLTKIRASYSRENPTFHDEFLKRSYEDLMTLQPSTAPSTNPIVSYQQMRTALRSRDLINFCEGISKGMAFLVVNGVRQNLLRTIVNYIVNTRFR